MVDDLEKNISDALVSDMARNPISSIARVPLERRNGNGAAEEREGARSAVDQLSLAVAGLLKIESEFVRLTEELVGPADKAPPIDAVKAPEQLQGLPMFDRVRGDARALAELALRIDQRIKFIREKL